MQHHAAANGKPAFEPAGEVSGGCSDHAGALGWMAMLVKTTGSDFWPLTPQGRVLALLLSIHGLANFGSIAASLATVFIGQDAVAPNGDVAGSREISALREEIAELREAWRGSAIG